MAFFTSTPPKPKVYPDRDIQNPFLEKNSKALNIPRKKILGLYLVIAISSIPWFALIYIKELTITTGLISVVFLMVTVIFYMIFITKQVQKQSEQWKVDNQMTDEDISKRVRAKNEKWERDNPNWELEFEGEQKDKAYKIQVLEKEIERLKNL